MERNPNGGQWKLPQGYKDLGWQKHSGNSEEIKNCVDLGHNNRNREPHWKEIDNALYKFRGTDTVYVCDECKIAWHIDSGD